MQNRAGRSRWDDCPIAPSRQPYQDVAEASKVGRHESGGRRLNFDNNLHYLTLQLSWFSNEICITENTVGYSGTETHECILEVTHEC